MFKVYFYGFFGRRLLSAFDCRSDAERYLDSLPPSIRSNSSITYSSN